MEPNSIPEHVRQFLSDSFADVRDEPLQKDYYVFSVKPPSGQLRHYMRVRRNGAIQSRRLLEYLRTHDFVGKMKTGNVDIY
jgi:hypothetical protein